MSAGGPLLVFTDMDGSLLDHDDYSWDAAAPLLAYLERLGIPVIPATSKTRAEIEALRLALGNGHPFIVENGAAVFIPRGYFTRPPEGVRECDGYWVYELSAPRERWLQVLAALAEEFPGEFTSFYRAGVAEIARMTGLAPQAAELANQREYSEPVLWLGAPSRREQFLQALRERGANPLQGGRFIAVAGACDKGRALLWVREAYRSGVPCQPVDELAIGDSGNDIAMLEAARSALVIKSPVHDYPQIKRTHDIIYSTQYGPQGWAEGVGQWLAARGLMGAMT